ncbi:MAG: transposase [Acetobacteraceae bacterium]|nr:transposase [Acetobacteraceae bacterium]
MFDGWVADCPLAFVSPNAPRKRDVLGTLMLSILAGHRRYAHITALRADPVNPPLLGMRKLISEDAVRRALAKIDETAGINWLQTHLDYCLMPLLQEPWILDADCTIKPLYGEQEGAVVSYNPRKPGRPSHCYHYMLSNLRLVLGVDVVAGDEHAPKHALEGLWSLLNRIGRPRWPTLLRGDSQWGVEPVMARAEGEGLPYLFRLRATLNVNRALRRAMLERDWTDAGQGWQGKEMQLRLQGWSRQRRVILLRRKLDRPLAMVDRGNLRRCN